MSCFYNGGLKFSCQQCNYCCSVEPGYVFLSERDINVLSAALSLEKQAFVSEYCRTVKVGAMELISLKENEHYDCIFLTDRGCSVYEARPVQCTTYPFWPDILESNENWNKEGKSCPGINKGTVHPYSEIVSCLKKREKNTPVIVFNRG